MIELDRVYVPSEDIVAREIEGEVIIIPLISGIGDADDDLFSLNETGKAVWDLLDGTRTLREVCSALGAVYDAELEEIQQDVLGLVEELERRGMLVEVTEA